MKRLFSLVALLSLVVGTLLLSGCYTTPRRGTVRASTTDPLVIIEAGIARWQYGGYYVRYLVDRSTRTCWFIMGGSVSSMSCCDLKRVPKARAIVSWATCSARSSSPPSSTPAPRGGAIPPPSP